MDTSYIALVGGRGKRLGGQKLTEIIAGRTLLERVVSCLISLEGEVIIVKARGQALPSLKDYPELRFIEDIYPDKGPLGGIFTGLSSSKSPINVVVAGDMPFISKHLLRYMVQLADGFDLVIPRIGDMVEPLHAVYTKSCLEPIRNLLWQEKLMVHKILDLVKVRYVESEEIERYDPAHLSFFNINTQAELERARRIAQEGHDNC